GGTHHRATGRCLGAFLLPTIKKRRHKQCEPREQGAGRENFQRSNQTRLSHRYGSFGDAVSIRNTPAVLLAFVLRATREKTIEMCGKPRDFTVVIRAIVRLPTACSGHPRNTVGCVTLPDAFVAGSSFRRSRRIPTALSSDDESWVRATGVPTVESAFPLLGYRQRLCLGAIAIQL